MIISIHQPAYLPWLGYFHKIFLSDIFVFFDTTQFEKNSFINRNRIKTPPGSTWLTVPVGLKNHLTKEIREIEIVVDQKWRARHWKAIELNYKKAKYWDVYSKELEKLYQEEYGKISDLCYDQLLLFLDWLEITTKIIKSSDLKPFNTKKLQLVLDICRDLGATSYVSGQLGRDYIDNNKFHDGGIKLYFQDYHHPEYEQLWGNEFLPYMCILDLVFNEGPKSRDIILYNNVVKQDLLTNSQLYE